MCWARCRVTGIGAIAGLAQKKTNSLRLRGYAHGRYRAWPGPVEWDGDPWHQVRSVFFLRCVRRPSFTRGIRHVHWTSAPLFDLMSRTYTAPSREGSTLRRLDAASAGLLPSQGSGRFNCRALCATAIIAGQIGP